MQNLHIAIRKIFYTITVVLIALIVWLSGALIGEQNIEWYKSLAHPSIRPPESIFYIVWIILFALIAASAIIILNKRTKDKKRCNIVISFFLTNAFLNVLFTIFYFGMQNILLAFLELPFLIASILLLIYCTHKISKTAAYLLIPYLLWTCFATVLVGITLFIN